MVRTVKAIGLISGGLDSTLAAAIVKEQGIEVEAINFSTGFCFSDHHRAMKSPTHRLRQEALRAGSDLEMPVTIIDIADDYFQDVLIAPRHGYGANMNPCLDCRAYMLGLAREYMEKAGADFVFTGEVLGQRPKSQFRAAMDIVAKESGLNDLLLRPLSAKLLPPTRAEREGWIDRERLLGISGRGRRQQMDEAMKRGLDLEEIPQPAGGCCFLTDESYARKLRDFLDHQDQPKRDAEAFVLMKVGRHLRLNDDVKVIVGRDESENEFMMRFRRGRWEFWAEVLNGPTVLVETQRELRWEEIEQIAGITARYCQGRDQNTVAVCFRSPPGEEDSFIQIDERIVERVSISPARLEEIEPLRV